MTTFRDALKVARRQETPARRELRVASVDRIERAVFVLVFLKERGMNLSISGHHLEVTPAIRAYVMEKLSRIKRHFDPVIDIHVVLSVEKLQQKAEMTVHVRGRDIHCEHIDGDLYAAIDALTDKLDRQLIRHKDRVQDHSRDALKHQELMEQ